jgi:hypothetical protein
MNRSLLAVLYLVVCSTPAWACLNDYFPNSQAMERSRTLATHLQEHHEGEPWQTRRDRLRKELAAGGDYRVKNDLATSLAHTGAAAESVKLLEEIEAEKPGLYRTASNLGTALELAGDDRKALEWIRRGIELDAEAHGGTEWLHARILEAKLALAGDPQWLETHAILGTREGGEVHLSATGNRGEPLSMDQVKTALIYQLHERLQFVPPPDAIVADLLLTLAQLVAHEPSGMGGAVDIFRLVENYLKDVPNATALQADADEGIAMARLAQHPRLGLSKFGEWAVLIVVTVLLCVLAVSVMRFSRHRSRA